MKHLKVYPNLRKLHKKIQPDKNMPGLDLRQGTVIATHAGPPLSIDVSLGGSPVTIPNVRYLSSYTPTIGDTIWAFKKGKDILVLGDLA